MLSDATHTLSAEFEGFYVPGPVGQSRRLPVSSCEGVAECIASGAQR